MFFSFSISFFLVYLCGISLVVCGDDELEMIVMNAFHFLYSFRVYLVPGKFERKCEGKKIEKKSRRKEKMKEKKNFKSINYFYMLLQIYFILFSLVI